MIRIFNHQVWAENLLKDRNPHRVLQPYNSNWQMPCRLKRVMMTPRPQVEVNKDSQIPMQTLTGLWRTETMSTALMLTTPWKPSSRKPLWLHNKSLRKSWVRPRNLTPCENSKLMNLGKAKDLLSRACITPTLVGGIAERCHLAERIDQSCPEQIEVTFLIW